MTEHLASFSIFPATPQQIQEYLRVISVEWRKNLTLEQFLEREKWLDRLEHAREHRMTTWVLAPRDNPESIAFKCGCETYRRVGLVSRSGGNVVEEVSCYAISSAFTRPSERSKGYASHMMRLLHWVLSPHSLFRKHGVFPEAWGTPPKEVSYAGNAAFSVLYSDVGRDLYRRCGPGTERDGGWVVKDVESTVLEVSLNSLNIGDGEEKRKGFEANYLDETRARAIWEKDARLMKDEMATHHQLGTNTGESVRVTMLPNEGVAAFQLKRSFYPPGTCDHNLTEWGVELLAVPKVKENENANLTFATWDTESGSSTLTINRLRTDPSTFPILLSLTKDAARKAGLTKIEIWNLPDDLREVSKASSLDGKTVERGDKLGAVMWYGDEDVANVRWVNNEKFAWC